MECVSDLILHNPNRCNRELIYSTFKEEEGNLIDCSESSTHVVRDCSFALQVWFKLNYLWSNSVAVMCFTDWLNWLFENSASDRKDEIAITIWALWFSRNKFVHEQKMQSIEELVTFIRGFGREFRGISSILQHPRPRDLNKWVPTPPNWVKINVDTGFSAARQHAASGFIIRNDEWLIMGSGFRTHNLVRSVVLAEATVVLHGLQFAPEMGFSNVILESDSKLVIQNLQSSKEDYSEIRPLTWDAKALARNFSSYRFEFVARDGNSTAHAMAVEGLKRFEDFFWVEDAPETALEMADSDQRFN
ncbi:hypothetical protein J1N35_043986 [Gossypium stocksii]|uniref:RNase H type-1 domain-containing protein n=1 Tax=Gossypium stocksii TaxID=47602 RepID=A0A9D3U8E3_9ROSI|nr:hypothetical protein J1N35_043986 [Gossypium stocksii]